MIREELILPEGADPDSDIPWVNGYDIMNDEEILVPANAVFHPLAHSYKLLFRTNTSGLASGNELEEAIFHGLAEVIERDAWALVEATRNTGPIIQNVGDGLAGDLLEKFSQAQVDVYLKDITSDIGIPTCAAVSDDIKLKDPDASYNRHGNAHLCRCRSAARPDRGSTIQAHPDSRSEGGYDRRRFSEADRL